MSHKIKDIFKILLCLFLCIETTFAQGAKKEGTIRDGGEQSAIQELKMHTNMELTKNYVQLFDCANYKPVGICIKPFPELKVRIMMRYFVPFQLTDSSNRPDATMFVERQKMRNQILKRAYKKISQGRSQYLKDGHDNIKEQKGETLEFPGETEDEVYQGFEDYHDEEKDYMGMIATMITQGYNVGGNHEWHNEMRDQEPFSEEENMFGWCHDYSKWAYSGKNDEHPEIDPFTSLGILDPQKETEKLIPLIAFFQELSRDDQLEDLKDRTPEKGDPLDFACYNKKHQNNVGHPKTFGSDDGPELVPEDIQGDEQSDEICPGNGFLGPAGPFWIFAKSYFPAGNALMASLRGLVVAWNTTVENPKDKTTVDEDTGRHRAHLFDDEHGYPSDHMQLIWPKKMEGWPAGSCDDTKEKEHYINPEWRPEDMGKANVWKDENFGHYYIMAHYTSIVCCPEGWIPITTEKLKEG